MSYACCSAHGDSPKRRVDVAEFAAWSRACGVEPPVAFALRPACWRGWTLYSVNYADGARSVGGTIGPGVNRVGAVVPSSSVLNPSVGLTRPGFLSAAGRRPGAHRPSGAGLART
jgi:hypothetical protein